LRSAFAAEEIREINLSIGVSAAEKLTVTETNEVGLCITFIYSSIPGKGKYDFAEGTGEAAPVVPGIAALIWSYFPRLTAVQLKEIIEQV